MFTTPCTRKYRMSSIYVHNVKLLDLQVFLGIKQLRFWPQLFFLVCRAFNYHLINMRTLNRITAEKFSLLVSINARNILGVFP